MRSYSKLVNYIYDLNIIMTSLTSVCDWLGRLNDQPRYMTRIQIKLYGSLYINYKMSNLFGQSKNMNRY